MAKKNIDPTYLKDWLRCVYPLVKLEDDAREKRLKEKATP